MQQAEPTSNLNEGADADPVFNDNVNDTTGLDTDAPEFEKTKIPEPTLFQEAAADEKRRKREKEQDVQIGLLIGSKNLVRLRAFGFDVVHASTSVPGSAHMGLAT